MSTFIEKYIYAIILFVVLLSFTIYSTMIKEAGEDSQSYVIVVDEGESLWTIAEKYSKESNLTTNEIVQLLKKENQLTYEMIKIGDTLTVPNQLVKKLELETHFVVQTE